MLDKDNRVLRRSIIWCDQRTAEECADMERRLTRERLVAVTANPALTGFTASKILWVRRHEPEIYEQCAHILLPKDYIRLMLTGEYATEVSDASGMQLLDVPNRCWSAEAVSYTHLDVYKRQAGPRAPVPDYREHFPARRGGKGHRQTHLHGRAGRYGEIHAVPGGRGLSLIHI